MEKVSLVCERDRLHYKKHVRGKELVLANSFTLSSTQLFREKQEIEGGALERHSTVNHTSMMTRTNKNNDV